MIGEKLTKGDEIEVEVLAIDIEKQRISLRIPMDDTDGEMTRARDPTEGHPISQS